MGSAEVYTSVDALRDNRNSEDNIEKWQYHVNWYGVYVQSRVEVFVSFRSVYGRREITYALMYNEYPNLLLSSIARAAGNFRCQCY